MNYYVELQTENSVRKVNLTYKSGVSLKLLASKEQMHQGTIMEIGFIDAGGTPCATWQKVGKKWLNCHGMPRQHPV